MKKFLIVCMVVGLAVVAAPIAGAQTYGGGNDDLSANSTTASEGGTLDLTGKGYQGNSQVNLTIQSTPTLLGTATTDASGAFTKRVAIPSSIGAGNHTITATGLAPDGSPRSLSLAVVIAASSTSPGALSRTGSNVATYVFVGVAFLVLGALALVAAMRRRAVSP